MGNKYAKPAKPMKAKGGKVDPLGVPIYTPKPIGDYLKTRNQLGPPHAMGEQTPEAKASMIRQMGIKPPPF